MPAASHRPGRQGESLFHQGNVALHFRSELGVNAPSAPGKEQPWWACTCHPQSPPALDLVSEPLKSRVYSCASWLACSVMVFGQQCVRWGADLKYFVITTCCFRALPQPSCKQVKIDCWVLTETWLGLPVITDSPVPVVSMTQTARP